MVDMKWLWAAIVLVVVVGVARLQHRRKNRKVLILISAATSSLVTLYAAIYEEPWAATAYLIISILLLIWGTVIPMVVLNSDQRRTGRYQSERYEPHKDETNSRLTALDPKILHRMTGCIAEDWDD